jgi:hypothetical protein
MFNPKMESRNKKMTKSLLKHCFFGFLIVVICFALKYHAAENFLIGGRESFEMAVVLGKCGRECLSGPSNTAFSHAEKADIMSTTGYFLRSTNVKNAFCDNTRLVAISDGLRSW